MFCRSCGEKYVDPNAAICVKCGVSKGEGVKFCNGCGVNTGSKAVVCTSCGIQLETSNSVGNKSRMAAGLLGILLGAFGIHNFYLGFISRGVIQLLMTVLSLGILWIASWIWGIVEGITILTNKQYKDATGKLLSD